MPNYEDENYYNDEKNKGQGIDPVGIAKEVNSLNNRIQQSRASKSNTDLQPTVEPSVSSVDPSVSPSVNPSVSPSVSPASPSVSPSVSPNVVPSVAPSVAPTVGSGALAAGGATTGSVAAGSTAIGSAMGSAAVEATTAFFATPAGWITLAAIIVAVFVTIIVVISGTGSAMGEATGTDENLLVYQCDENDEECKKIVSYLKGDYSGLRSQDLYNMLLNYCGKNQPLATKLENFISDLFNIDPTIHDGCDLATLIDKYIKEKESNTGLQLSRGLIVATIQWLYNNIIPSKEELNDKNDELYTSSPNSILVNIAKSGKVTAKDIKTLVDYMVFDESYSFYNWQIKGEPEKYDCQTIYDENDVATEKCKTRITYGCEKIRVDTQYMSLEKYFMFLRFGSSHSGSFKFNSDNSDIIFNKTKVKDGVIIIEEDPNAIDPTVSYQEITNYNSGYDTSSESCKFEGLAQIPDDTDDVDYVLDEQSVKDAIKALEHGPIDLSSYSVDPLTVESAVIVPVVKQKNSEGKDCQLNHSPEYIEGCVVDGSITYLEGYIFLKYPKYSYADDGATLDGIIGDTYNEFARSIEDNVIFVDEYEEFLNDIFGFGPNPYGNIGFYPGVPGYPGTSGGICSKYSSYKIRLRTCKNATEEEKKKYKEFFPGGSSLIDGNYVSNNTISFDDYIKGVTVIEFGGKHMTEKEKEALKFQLIIQKSYVLFLLEGGYDRIEKNGDELIISVGSACAQNFGSVSNLSQSQKSVLDSAYSDVASVLLYNEDTNSVHQAEFGEELTDYITKEARDNDYAYNELLDLPYVRSYKKNGADYSNAIFYNCSVTSQLGYDFVENAKLFLTGGSGEGGGWMNKDFMANGQYRAISDFQYDSAWCARFVNLIKELTPNVAAIIGKVSGQAGVKYWIEHFATKSGLTFYSSEQYASVGFYQNRERFLYSNGVYIPKAGDIIFYAYTVINGVKQEPWNGKPLDSDYQDHIAIIAAVYQKGNKICIDTVEGNVGGKGDEGNSVKYFECIYYTSHPSIVGYGVWE